MRHVYSSIALALLATTAARAEVTVFDNEADFRDAAPGGLFREDFTDLPDMQVPVRIEINNVEYETQGTWQLPGGCSVDRGLGASSIAPRRLTFVRQDGTQGFVRAFGFRITTFAIAPPADYFVSVLTRDGQITTVPVPDVTNGAPAYRGFVSDAAPIVSVFTGAVGLTQFNFCFDNVSHGAIIVPAE